MKKLTAVLFIVLFALVSTFLNKCSIGHAPPDPSKYPPFKQNNTRWNTDDADIYFIVDERDGMIGELQFNGIVTVIQFGFQDDAVSVAVYDPDRSAADADEILNGLCKFYQDKFIIFVSDVNRPDLFDASVTELTFVKDESYMPENAD